jgi:hypothetical protein
MQKPLLVIAAAMLVLFAAEARAAIPRDEYGRPESLRMTCAQAQEYIIKNDGAVLATGGVYGNYQTFYCNSGSYPGSAPAYVRTKDQSVCLVGVSCNCHTGYCPQIYWQGVE